MAAMTPGSFMLGSPLKPPCTLWMAPALFRVPRIVVSAMLTPVVSELITVVRALAVAWQVGSVSVHKECAEIR
ncbi:hypothetical protein MAUB_31030 [Mycolicibacterium aubagnense]|uniref:Uncharacterized protein n=1 Tax=Mycolicibacterium aubagnense TaxID=319707 RepID=A0ABN5YVQ3_9MYCO|nr:hypothetical protein MAUB_31030 [Mycolicibacterium aubagnense]